MPETPDADRGTERASDPETGPAAGPETVAGTALLFPRDPLNPRRVDPHFAREAAAARELGRTVATVDHDAAATGDAAEAVARVPRDLGGAFYRGWMVTSSAYERLDGELRARGVRLRTTPAAYRRAHELPGWYAHFRELTPASRMVPLELGEHPSAARLAEEAAALPPGPAIVKDWVKSRKHEWETACFVPDLADTARLASVVGAFLEGQAEFLAGGVVLRAYEELAGPETRVWWFDGEPLFLTPHPDARDGSPGPVPDASVTDRVGEAVRALDAPFVTTDLALRADGVWRVVEVGDGQVSDLHADADPSALLGPLGGVAS